MPFALPDNEIDINARITKDNVWRDVDLGTNNDVPADTQVIILHVRNTSATTSYVAAVRPKGSSINPGCSIASLTYEYLFVKLDSSRVFQAKVNNAAMDLRVVAYTNDNLSIYPYVDKTPATAGSFQDVDVSGDGVPAGSAAALIYADMASGANKQWAIRKNGTSYDSYWYQDGYTQGLLLGALDASRITEIKTQVTTNKFWLQGYLPSAQGAMFDAPTEKTPAAAGSWQDVDCSAFIPAGAVAAILEVRNTGASNWIACVRKKGSSDDFTASNKAGSWRHHHPVVGLDSSRVFQAYVGHATEVDIFVLGYIVPPPTQTISGAGNIASGEAEGTPSVSPGGVSLLPSGIGSEATFGSPAVHPGAVTLQPAGLASGEALPGPVVLPGCVTIGPEGIDSAEGQGTPLILPGLVSIMPTGIVSAEVLGSPRLLPGAVALYPLAIGSAEVWGIPRIYRIPQGISLSVETSRLLAAGEIRRLKVAG